MPSRRISSASILGRNPSSSTRTTIPPRTIVPPRTPSVRARTDVINARNIVRDDQRRTSLIQEIQKSLLEIIRILQDQRILERNRQERDRRYFETERRRSRERRLEARSDGTISSAFEKMVSPIKPLLKRIFEFIIGLILAKSFIKLIKWFSNAENKKKVDAIFRFLGENWPKLLGLYVIFGTGLGKFARGLIGLVIHGTRRLIAASARLLGLAGLKSFGKFGKFLGGPKGRAIGTVLEVGAAVAGGLYLTKQIEGFTGLNTEPDKKKEQPIKKYAGGGLARPGNFFSMLNQRSGMVRGAKGVDQVPAMLSDGEFVMSRGAVQKYGVDTLEAMNASGGGTNVPKIVSGIPHAAGGGLMGSDPGSKLSPLEIKFANRARQRGITDPIELKAFLAQVNHESGGNFGSPRRELFDKSPNDPPGKPGYEYFKGYTGMIGNRNADDAYKYMGRGYLMITGRANYEKYGKKIGKDLLNNPQLLLTNSDTALDASIEYWKDMVRPNVKNWSNVFDVSRQVNNPSATSPDQIMHMNDRIQKFKRYDSIPNDKFLQLLNPPKSTDKKSNQGSFIENIGKFFQRFIPKSSGGQLKASTDNVLPQDSSYPILKAESIAPIQTASRYNITPTPRSNVKVIQLDSNGSVTPKLSTAPIGTPSIPSINPYDPSSQSSRNAAIYGVG